MYIHCVIRTYFRNLRGMGYMFVIGITGGVGSGKSLVAKFLSKKYNAKLLIAD